jgi:hypothetical protein
MDHAVLSVDDDQPYSLCVKKYPSWLRNALPHNSKDTFVTPCLGPTTLLGLFHLLVSEDLELLCTVLFSVRSLIGFFGREPEHLPELVDEAYLTLVKLALRDTGREP